MARNLVTPRYLQVPANPTPTRKGIRVRVGWYPTQMGWSASGVSSAVALDLQSISYRGVGAREAAKPTKGAVTEKAWIPKWGVGDRAGLWWLRRLPSGFQ